MVLTPRRPESRCGLRRLRPPGGGGQIQGREAWLVTGHGSETKLLTLTPTAAQKAQGGPYGPIGRVIQSVVGDDKGIWLATTEGMYLSTSERTEKVSTVTVQLGGGCA